MDTTQNLVRSSELRLKAIIDAEPACVKIVSADGILLDILGPPASAALH